MRPKKGCEANAAESAARMRLLRSGMSDVEIGRARGVDPSSIRDWRRQRNLPSARQAAKRDSGGRDMQSWRSPVEPSAIRSSAHPMLSPERHAVRALFYTLGWDDTMIARQTGVTRHSLRAWRQLRGLPANRKWGASTAMLRVPKIADLVTECRRAVGHYLPRDIAEDAVSEIVLDVMTGKLALDSIDASARRYGNSVIAAFANKFGQRSLDEEIGDSEGFTLLDTIADDNASSWLEEMGATVC